MKQTLTALGIAGLLAAAVGLSQAHRVLPTERTPPALANGDYATCALASVKAIPVAMRGNKATIRKPPNPSRLNDLKDSRKKPGIYPEPEVWSKSIPSLGSGLGATIAIALPANPPGEKTHTGVEGHIQALQKVDRMIQAGDYKGAGNEWEKQRAEYGLSKELRLRRAYISLNEGFSGHAVQDFKVEFPPEEPQRLLDKLTVLAGSSPDPVAKRKLDRVAGYHQLRHADPHGKVELRPKSYGVSLYYQPSQPLSVEPATVAELALMQPGNFSLYVQDSPKLNHLDWSNPVEYSLHQITTIGKGKVVRLSDASIANFTPDELIVHDVPVKLRAIVANKTPARPYARWRSEPPGGNCPGSTPELTKVCTSPQSAYASSRPVYVLFADPQ